MQNNVIVLGVALFLRLLQGVAKAAAETFGLRGARSGSIGLGAFSPGIDLDSSRLDVVSRSLWWGSGMLIPEPVRRTDGPPLPVPRAFRGAGAGPEMFGGRG